MWREICGDNNLSQEYRYFACRQAGFCFKTAQRENVPMPFAWLGTFFLFFSKPLRSTPFGVDTAANQ